MKAQRYETSPHISLPETSTSDLRGKQSVRATFKLTEQCIAAVSIVSAHLGIKQKSLFDHLIEDAASLNMIAQEIKDADITKKNRIQKTFVISRRTLATLEEISKTYNAPRDTLVEYSILRLFPIIAKERIKHERRKVVFDQITKHIRAGKKMLTMAKESLGEEDQVYSRFESAISVYENVYANIKSYIERGKIIEEFKSESSMSEMDPDN
jgi:hypothetical protein